jgi:photosystem II stability/assembly factor-like uncharacterized protein
MRPKLFRNVSLLAISLLIIAVGVLIAFQMQAKRAKRSRLQAQLARVLHPALEKSPQSHNLVFLHMSSEQRARLTEYDDPLLEAEFFRAQRVASSQQKPGAGPIAYSKYIDANNKLWQLRQFSLAFNRRLPSRAQMANLGQLHMAVTGFVTSETSTNTGPVLGNWKPLGPDNVGGRTRSIVFDPHNPLIMYAAAAAGGVWKSIDGGTSWTAVADFLADIAVNALAIDPVNSSIIYAGTGEGYFNIDATRGQGIFRSSDAGAHWQQISSTNNKDFYYVRKIVISPRDSNRVYAATATGLFRTDDAGDHWNKVLDEESILGCLDIAVQESTPNQVFASCGTFNPGAVFRAADAAQQQWQQVLNAPNMGRTSLALAPSNQNTIYALASSTSSGQFQNGLLAVFRSDSNGDPGSWRSTVDNTNSNIVNTLLLSNPVQAVYSDCFNQGQNQFLNQGWYDNIIAVDPKNPNSVWVGGTDLFRSDDGGSTWGVASYWWLKPREDPQYAHADHHAIAFHPHYDGSSNQVIFVGNDGGIFQTSNARAAVGKDLTSLCGEVPANAVQWTVRNGKYGVTQFYSGAVLPSETSYFGGTQDNGTVSGAPAASDAWSTLQGGDGGYVAFNPSQPSTIFAAFTGPSIKKSSDGGKSFVDANVGLCACGQNCSARPDDCSVFGFIVPYALDQRNPQLMWTGGDRIFRSSDAGASWKPASIKFSADSYPKNTPPVASGVLSALGINPNNSNNVLAGFAPSDSLGTGGGWIHRTEAATTADGNSVWTRVRPRAGWVSSIAFDPSDTNVVYAAYSSFNSNDGHDVGHVFKSTDNGKTWNNLDGNTAQKIPDIPVHSIIVDPIDPHRLYVGTDLGILVSLDGGNTWNVESSAFPNVVVQQLIYTAGPQPHLYAFTHGRGLWVVDVKR